MTASGWLAIPWASWIAWFAALMVLVSVLLTLRALTVAERDRRRRRALLWDYKMWSLELSEFEWIATPISAPLTAGDFERWADEAES